MSQGTDKERYVFFQEDCKATLGYIVLGTVYIGCEMIGNKRQQTDTCQLLHVVTLRGILCGFKVSKTRPRGPRRKTSVSLIVHTLGNECKCKLLLDDSPLPGGALSAFLSPSVSVRNGVLLLKRRSFNAFLETVTLTLNAHNRAPTFGGKLFG